MRVRIIENMIQVLCRPWVELFLKRAHTQISIISREDAGEFGVDVSKSAWLFDGQDVTTAGLVMMMLWEGSLKVATPSERVRRRRRGWRGDDPGAARTERVWAKLRMQCRRQWKSVDRVDRRGRDDRATAQLLQWKNYSDDKKRKKNIELKGFRVGGVDPVIIKDGTVPQFLDAEVGQLDASTTRGKGGGRRAKTNRKKTDWAWRSSYYVRNPHATSTSKMGQLRRRRRRRRRKYR